VLIECVPILTSSPCTRNKQHKQLFTGNICTLQLNYTETIALVHESGSPPGTIIQIFAPLSNIWSTFVFTTQLEQKYTDKLIRTDSYTEHHKVKHTRKINKQTLPTTPHTQRTSLRPSSLHSISTASSRTIFTYSSNPRNVPTISFSLYIQKQNPNVLRKKYTILQNGDDITIYLHEHPNSAADAFVYQSEGLNLRCHYC